MAVALTGTSSSFPRWASSSDGRFLSLSGLVFLLSSGTTTLFLGATTGVTTLSLLPGMYSGSKMTSRVPWVRIKISVPTVPCNGT